MRVLIVTQYFYPEPFRINDLALALRDRGHQVSVLTGMPNYPEGRLYPGYGWYSPSTESYQGIPVIRVPLVTRGPIKGWRLILNYLSFALSACLLGPLRCRTAIDIVLVYEPSPITVGLPGMLLGEIKRTPVMLWIQDLWPDTLAAVGKSGFFTYIASGISNFIHRGSDMLLVQSKAFAQPLIARGILPARIRYLPNWAEDFYKQEKPTTVASSLGTFRGTQILFAGNIGSAQSFETIIEAADSLKNRNDIRWVIVGDGVMRGWVEEQIRLRRLESSVVLLGRRAPEHMPVLFSSADMLLVTLRANPVFAMTIPSKIQSYLASGVAIVGALDGEGARIIAEAGAGFTTRAEDAQGLAQCVVKMAGLPPAERAAMGLRGRAYFDKHFGREALLDRLETWIYELVKASHADSDTRR